jgi:hypothetical protein
LVKVLREREQQKILDQKRMYDLVGFCLIFCVEVDDSFCCQACLEKDKMAALVKKAMKSCSDFNANFNREKREERKMFFDLQTMV